MAYTPKRFSPLRRPQGETVDQLGQRLDRVQDALKAQLDPMATALATTDASLGTGASADISTDPALPLAATAQSGSTGQASDAGHRHPYPDITSLPGIGTKYQALQTNSGATATEWIEPFAESSFNLPVFSNDHAAAIVSFVGIQSFGNATTGIINLNGNVDRLYAMPWPCGSTDNLAGIMWEVTTGHAATVVNYAVYESDASGYPSNRIGAVSGLSLAATGTFQSAWASPVPVTRGRLYWIAWTTNSAATAQTRIRPVPTWSNLGFLFSSGNLNFGGGATPVTHLRATVTYAVPPATFPTAASAPPTQFPIVGVYA